MEIPKVSVFARAMYWHLGRWKFTTSMLKKKTFIIGGLTDLVNAANL